MRRALIHFLWAALGCVTLASLIAFIAIWNGWIGYMPDVEDLQNPISKYASQVYTADNKLMGTYNMNQENRIHVDYDNLSPYLVKALVATEDERFYEHSGIDFIALGRAIIKRGVLGPAQEEALQSHSSSPSSSIQTRQRAHRNDCCRSP